jgi:hypothetical protein
MVRTYLQDAEQVWTGAGFSPAKLTDFFRRALDGDEEAAQTLNLMMPNSGRSLALGAMIQSGAPKSLVAGLLRTVWAHDHDQLLSLFGQEGSVQLFKDFPTSHGIQAPIPVYRGFVGTPEAAATGLSWTTKFHVARFFACEYGRRPIGPPTIIKSVASPHEILARFDERSEFEILLDGRSHYTVVTDMEH